MGKPDGAVRVAAVQLDYTPSMVAAGPGRLWVPTEPLLGAPLFERRIDRAHSVAELSRQSTGSMASIESRLKKMDYENLKRKAIQIFDFLFNHEVDIALLPEYALRPELLPTLVGFADNMVIVTGLGYVREEDQHYFEETDAEAPDVGSNVAVAYGPKGLRVVCRKGHPAEDEVMAAGEGPVTFQASCANRDVTVGLAICMDYLHIGHTFGSRSGDLDLVLIPALSRDTQDFTPKKSRDFVRVIANHSVFGGSGVFMSGISGPTFFDAEGTIPLVRGEEAIAAVDVERPRSRRSSTKATRNQVALRAALTYKAESDMASEVTAGLARLSDLHLNPDQLDRLAEWNNRLETTSGSTVLRESITELHSQVIRGMVDKDSMELLTKHLSLNEVKSEPTLTSLKASLVADRLWAGLKTLTDPRGVSAAFGEYEYAGRGGIEPISPEDLEKTADERVLFSVSLGSFDQDDAVSTLPQQLTLLRALADRADSRVSLIYRLRTSDHARTGRPMSTMEILGVARGLEPDEREELRNLLEGYVRTTFVTGWGIGQGEKIPSLAPTWRVEIRPKVENSFFHPPIKDDWAALVDQFRRLDRHVSLDLVCSPGKPVAEPKEILEPDISPERAIKEYERLAAGFLAEASRRAKGWGPLLSLRVFFSGEGDRPDWMLSVVARELFGNSPYTLVEHDFAGSMAGEDDFDDQTLLRPEELLRIFHPPYGDIQARGVRGRETHVPIPDIEFPPAGLCLGRATRLTNREDEAVDVRLDDEARLRHTYIVGKTGSGKTNLLKHLVRQDLETGRGFAVIDPHGDLVEYALGHATSRIEDTVLLDFGQRDLLPVLNPLTLDCNSPADTDLAIEELIEIVGRRVKADYAGPVFEDALRMVFESITHQRFREIAPPSILYAGPILHSRDAINWMKQIFAGSELGDRWTNFEGLKNEVRHETTRWVMSKFAELSRESVLRGVLGGPASSLSIDETVDKRRVLLVSLPESVIGSRAVSFLGSVIFARIRRALFDKRRTQSGQGVQPFFLYVDEFQKFVGAGFEELIAEARKFGLGLTIAHQNLRQLEFFSRYEDRPTDALIENLLGNVGNVAVMRTGPRDATRFARELSVPEGQVLRIGQFDALARVVANREETGAFTLENSDADGELGLPRTRHLIRKRMTDTKTWLPTAKLHQDFEENLSRLHDAWSA